MKLNEVQAMIETHGFNSAKITNTTVFFDGLSVKHSGDTESANFLSEILTILKKMKAEKNSKIPLNG